MSAITHRRCLGGMLAATAGIALAPAALAQDAGGQTVARADTLITTGQPSVLTERLGLNAADTRETQP